MSTNNLVVPSISYQQSGGFLATPFKTTGLPIFQNILNNKTMRKFNQNLVQDLKLSKCGTAQVIFADILCASQWEEFGSAHRTQVLISETLHGTQFVEPDTLHGTQFVEPDTLHGTQFVEPDTLHGTQFVEPDTLHGTQFVEPDTLHGTQFVEPDTLHSWTDHYSQSGNLYRYALVNRGTHIDVAIQTPSYGSLASDFQTIHKLPLEGAEPGICKICCNPGKEPKTVEKAIGLMKDYVELTDTYINTGKTIDQQVIERSN